MLATRINLVVRIQYFNIFVLIHKGKSKTTYSIRGERDLVQEKNTNKILEKGQVIQKRYNITSLHE